MPGVNQPSTSEVAVHRATVNSSLNTDHSPSNNKRIKTSHNVVNTPDHPEVDRKATLIHKVTNRPDYTPTVVHPYDVTFLGDSILIAEGLWPQSRLQGFDFQGRSKRELSKGQVLPFGIAYNATERQVAVTDHKERTVKIFDLQGQLIKSWARDMFNWPNGIALNNFGQYVVADWAVGTVGVFDGNGTKVLTFKTNANDPAEQSCPEFVVVDKQDRIIVSDTYDHSVKVFDHFGQYLCRFGQEEGPGRITDPRGLALDEHGDVIVADWGGNSLKRYTINGKWMEDIVTSEQGLQYPWGVAYNSENHILAVTEQKLNCNPALQLFKWEVQR